jgi:hypothetical protein
MTQPKSPILPPKSKQGLLFFLGLAFTFAGYFALQFLGAFVWFFTYCCGESGNHYATQIIGAVFVALHVGILCLLFRKQILYTTWLALAVNVGLAIGLFVFLEVLNDLQRHWLTI